MSKIQLIRPGLLIDGTGRAAIPQASIVIQDGLIRAVETGGQSPIPPGDGVEVLDVPDLVLLPGLIDAHVHLALSGGDNPIGDLLSDDDDTILLRSTRNAQAVLCAGITTVRDCGGPRQTVRSLRRAIDAGIVAGPRVVASISPITTTAGHCWWMSREADTADEVRKAARTLIREGADFLKLMGTGGGLTPGTNVRAPQYSVEEMAAAVAEGRRLQKRVGAHLHATAGIRNAVAAGVDTLEHCSWLGPVEGLEFDERLVNDMARQGTFVVPTVVPDYWSLLSQQGQEGATRGKSTLRKELMSFYRQMLGAGVRFLSGTDAGGKQMPFDALTDNVGAFVHLLGMSPLTAIRSTTQLSAQALDLDSQIGSVEVGKRADLILVEGDPSQDLGALKRVRWVLRDGRIVARDGQLVVNEGALRWAVRSGSAPAPAGAGN